MPRLLLVLLMLLTPFLTACIPASLPVHYAGLAANRALPVLVRLEEREGDVVIAAHQGDDRAANDGLAAVEARWAPFWDAWDAFIAAQHAWADAFDTKAPAAKLLAAEKTAVAAFCVVRKALPADVPPALLDAPEVPCAP